MTLPSSPEESAEKPAGDSAANPAPRPAEAPAGIVEIELPQGSSPTEPVAGEPMAGRRIAIGTQRSGVVAPTATPRYRYVVSQPARAAAAPAGPPADRMPDRRGAMPATAAAAPDVAVPGPPPGDTPVLRTPVPAGPPAVGGSGRRVVVPRTRGPLDDDLEADFRAAIEGLEVEQVLAAADDRRIEAPIEPGTRLSATVLSVGGDTVFVDLGGRRQGALKVTGWQEEGRELPEVGQTIDVAVGGRNREDNLYEVAPANRAIAVEDWSQLEPGMVVAARVTAANKGGLECDVGGLRGFMPASLVSTWRIENLEELVGQSLEALVTDLVPAARRLVLSRRAVLERQAADARARLLESLEPGAVFEGIVRSVRDFGAFVDIGDGVEGLVHVGEMSWERVNDPTELFKSGEKIRVVVKKVDRQTGKIGLSVKDLVESPWRRAAEKYPVGSTVRGTVTRLAQFGAFVRLEPGVEGLVHVSELATRHVRSVADVVREGAEIECRVLAIDPDGQRLSLSIKALAPVPAAVAAAPEPDPEPAAPQPGRSRSAPLKGGLGAGSGRSAAAGEKFGLRW